MQKDIKKLKFIDLFAGIGGFRIALESFGANCVFSSDIDVEARKTYKENFGDLPEGDITKIDSRDIPKHDILCAGFPCQPFSISGKRLGFEDARGTLFYDILRIAEYSQPNFLLLENVANLIKHNGGKTLNTILNILDSINYDVSFSVLNASEFGVPQSRKRVYFVCVRKDLRLKKYVFPSPSFEKTSIKDIAFDDKETQKLILDRKDIFIDEKKVKLSSSGNYFFKPVRVGFVNKGGQGERIYHENGHAITLSAYGGGVGAKTGLYLINNVVRKLSPEECKRAMSFPENFKISANPNQAYKQFGNSVVVKVLKCVFKKLIEDFNGQALI
ncbi:MAG TPA: DNA (cytosine-5-)-methyltransferase [Spirochaetota bacterium]|nr:DNA (cytosine-5-)-methyltransferase [Spirochaetota bacterium]